MVADCKVCNEGEICPVCAVQEDGVRREAFDGWRQIFRGPACERCKRLSWHTYYKDGNDFLCWDCLVKEVNG